MDATVLGKGSLGFCNPPLRWTAPDTLGGYTNQLTYWDNCGGGFCGRITVSGAPLTDPNPPAAGSVSVDVTYYDSPGAGSQNNEILSVSGNFE